MNARFARSPDGLHCAVGTPCSFRPWEARRIADRGGACAEGAAPLARRPTTLAGPLRRAAGLRPSFELHAPCTWDLRRREDGPARSRRASKPVQARPKLREQMT